MAASAAIIDPAQARQLVDEIAANHGYLPPHVVAAIPAETRSIVLQALQKKDNMIAASVSTLAQNLYSSSARFIFELLQNAADNSYTKALATHQDPYVSFSVYPDRLVVECNEDGFTRENLTAICNIGQSSKHGAQGYIGEKGIGFKSTFMAAWKVQIESGPFTFYFEHRIGDSGMGMITPMWFEPQEEFSGPGTQISLYFHDNGTPGDLEKRREEVITQLKELQGEVLLFVNKLRAIKIAVFEPSGDKKWSKTMTMSASPNSKHVSELRTSEFDGSNGTDLDMVRKFHVVKHLATKLSKNENRSYSEAEEALALYSTSQVTLAFPLDHNDEPITEVQDVFAFMPVRKVGFNFLIHADFVTQANRQDIVWTSQRNIGLRKAITQALVNSLKELAEHPALRYKWMRYLPCGSTLNHSPFWNDMISELKSPLSEVQILVPMRQAARRTIQQMRRLETRHLDKNGHPLIPDTWNNPLYLSKEYEAKDLDILTEYGLSMLQLDEVYPILSEMVKLQSWIDALFKNRDEDWHTRLANLIMAAMDYDTTPKADTMQFSGSPSPPSSTTGLFSFGGSQTANTQIKGNSSPLPPTPPLFSFGVPGTTTANVTGVTNLFSSASSTTRLFPFGGNDTNPTRASSRTRFAALSLIPLASGEVRPCTVLSPDKTNPCYFPDINGVPVPRDLVPNVILPAAAANASCCQLYEKLGAMKPLPKVVLASLAGRYNVFDKNDVSLEETKDHLVWLYRMKLPSSGPEAKVQSLYAQSSWALESILLYDHKNRRVCPKQKLIYLPSEGKYSPQNWLRPVEIPGKPDDEVDVSHLHPHYLGNPPHQPLDSEWTWEEWLRHTFKMSKRVNYIVNRLHLGRKTKALSSEAIFLTKYRSEEVLTYFATNWGSDFRKQWEEDPEGTALIRNHAFRCMSEDKTCALRNAFLPFPALLDRCGIFLEKPEVLDFLKVEAPLQDDDPGWMGFGKYFSINVHYDLRLFLSILQAIKIGASAPATSTSEAVTKLYLQIYAQYLTVDNRDRDVAREQVRALDDVILLGEDIWVKPYQCLWDAPLGFSSMTPIGEIWKERMDTIEPQDSDSLANFFRHLLGVKNTTIQNILDELAWKRQLTASDPKYTTLGDGLPATYKLLDELRATTATGKMMKHLKFVFTSGKMIYVPSSKSDKRWFRASECLWSANGAVVGKPCLDEFYPDLEDFFHTFLDIPQLDLKLLYQELVDMRDTVPTAADAKSILLSLNAMLSASEEEGSVSFGLAAKGCHVFPAILPDGTVKVLSSRDDFAIGDRQHYTDALKNTLTILDLTLDEVSRLRHVFEWFGLEDRYLSQAVVEETVVQGGQGERLNSLTRDLALKAPALVSIAAYFDASISPDTLNAKLQKVQVYTTDSIISTLIANENGKMIKLPIGKSELHIQRSADGTLQIYVPSDQDSRDFAVASRLPREFIAALLESKASSVDARAVTIVASVLQAKRSHISRILELNGVPELKLPCHVGDGYLVAEVEAEEQKIALLPRSPGRTSQLPPAPQVLYDEDAWRGVLTHVVEAARAHHFPTKSGEMDLPQALNGLKISGAKPKPKPLKFIHPNTDEWRRMVGAAGELFVFEMLNNIDPSLPNFGQSNWQSVIRKFVTVHPDYSEMDAWVGEEDGDIQYKDEQNVLTDYLIERGYFDESWVGECPEYHIEVKTSIGSVDMPFHMSKSQYNRMQRYWSNASTESSRKKVFAIFRVYGLESGDIGVKVYVDAESANQDGSLRFEADSWVVRAL